MKHLFSIVLVFIFTSNVFSSNNNETTITDNKTYKIGDYAHGGIVFWVDETGEHGLVTTKQDIASEIQWAPQRTKRTYDKRVAGVNSTSTSIFGKKERNHEGKKRSYARKVCKKLKLKENGKSYSDWKLPTKEELNKIYLNRDIINKTALNNNGSTLTDGYYWSSTEEDMHNAWIQYFKTGKQSYYFKHYFYNIRAVRSF